MSVISMKQLLEAGVHFGHQTRRWNPKMAPYIYTERNGIYIIDLQKSVGKVDEAYDAVSDIAAQGGTILFVGTKKQAQDAIKTEAERCGMYYVNERWLGGMLTNFRTIESRIARLKAIETMAEDGTFDVLPKKEVIALKKEWDKLEKNLGGIKDMKRIPDAIFVVDPKKERICIKEAQALGITLIGIADTNCDPDCPASGCPVRFRFFGKKYQSLWQRSLFFHYYIHLQQSRKASLLQPYQVFWLFLLFLYQTWTAYCRENQSS